MNEGLDFSIPEPETKVKKSSNKYLYILMIIILAAVVGNTIIQLYNVGSTNSPINEGPGIGKLKQLALKMENQGLVDSSVDAWLEYLSRSSGDAEEKARIWYRIGKLYQGDHRFELALNAYYRSEAYAKPEDITFEISRKTQECLESLGKFAALNYELKERVGIEEQDNKDNSNNPVIAEIGGTKIRRSDLDGRIEKLIETQLSRMAPYLPEQQSKKEKERLLKQYATDSQRRMFLDQYIVEELLYRKARESGLANDIEVKETIREMERAILAGKALEKEYTDEIKITLTDLKSYFEANKEKYVEDEKEDKKEPEFDEVKDRVAFDLRSNKEKDVQNRLLSDLKDKYNVVIHNSVLSDKSDGEAGDQANTSK